MYTAMKAWLSKLLKGLWSYLHSDVSLIDPEQKISDQSVSQGVSVNITYNQEIVDYSTHNFQQNVNTSLNEETYGLLFKKYRDIPRFQESLDKVLPLESAQALRMGTKTVSVDRITSHDSSADYNGKEIEASRVNKLKGSLEMFSGDLERLIRAPWLIKELDLALDLEGYTEDFSTLAHLMLKKLFYGYFTSDYHVFALYFSPVILGARSFVVTFERTKHALKHPSLIKEAPLAPQIRFGTLGTDLPVFVGTFRELLFSITGDVDLPLRPETVYLGGVNPLTGRNTQRLQGGRSQIIIYDKFKQSQKQIYQDTLRIEFRFRFYKHDSEIEFNTKLENPAVSKAELSRVTKGSSVVRSLKKLYLSTRSASTYFDLAQDANQFHSLLIDRALRSALNLKRDPGKILLGNLMKGRSVKMGNWRSDEDWDYFLRRVAPQPRPSPPYRLESDAIFIEAFIELVDLKVFKEEFLSIPSKQDGE